MPGDICGGFPDYRPRPVPVRGPARARDDGLPVPRPSLLAFLEVFEPCFENAFDAQ